jgi:poly-gamma-glutamate synthesis protein (capsule biosynthesis protein)
MHIVYLSILVAVVTYGFTVFNRIEALADSAEFPESQYGAVTIAFHSGSMLFGGDVMLGRGVEEIMEAEDFDFPYKKIQTFVQSHDVAIANFEASVPDTHKTTKSGELQFSVSRSALKGLRDAGFDIMSLSNNHALDYGERGYLHTRSGLEDIGLEAIGHPTNHEEYGSTVITVGDTKVGILAVHTLHNRNATTSFESLIDSLETQSDVQFVFVHWGEEYKKEHDRPEEELAHFLIDQGIDAIIGHHPHVIQDVELYKNKPIFYSLGNLVFDQYFNPDVQTGYFVQTVFEKDRIRFEIVPHDSLKIRSQPSLQIGDERNSTLQTILSNPSFNDADRSSGVFYTSYDTTS